jgi:DNA-binding transcriptional LysR family regulator
MNIHHLELFHYVAKHRGIANAVRNIPYGIQQPAVSAQVIQLENDLGTPLFQRRPFELTPAGKELQQFVQPFFDDLEMVSEKIRGGAAQVIRIGASHVVLSEHLPRLLLDARLEFQNLRPMLRGGIQPQIEEWLLADEVDLGVTALAHNPPRELKHEKLVELPMALLVPRKSRVKTAADVLEQDRIAQPLISLPQSEALVKIFQKELGKRGIDWAVGMEMNTLELIDTYVAKGFGIGLTLQLPNRKPPAGLQQLPLEGFPSIHIGVLWRGRPTPLAEALIQLLRQHAQSL